MFLPMKLKEQLQLTMRDYIYDGDFYRKDIFFQERQERYIVQYMRALKFLVQSRYLLKDVLLDQNLVNKYD